MKMVRWILACCIVLTCAVGCQQSKDDKEKTGEEKVKVTVASKLFTESVVLGAVLERLAETVGAEAEHKEQLGATQILWQAIQRGDLDAYIDYTGTLMRETFAQEEFTTLEQVSEKMAELGLKMSKPIGFNNTYAFGTLSSTAEERGLTKISDLQGHPDMKFGFSNEFMHRSDGWTPLKATYKLPQTDVKGLEHELAYRALETSQIDLTDLYTTDAKIQRYDLTVLEDDLNFFPKYYAVVIYRVDLEERAPDVVKAFLKLEGALTESQMTALNAKSELESMNEKVIAAEFVKERFPDLTSGATERP